MEGGRERIDGLAGALADRLEALDQHRAVEIKVADDGRSTVEPHRHQIGEGNLGATGCGNVEILQAVDGFAPAALGLHIHLAVLTVLVGLIHERPTVNRP